MPQPFIIGVSGGSSSGKTSLCQALFDAIGEKFCTILHTKSFYKAEALHNFEHPDNIDFIGLCKAIEDLKRFQTVNLLTHNLAQNTSENTEIVPAKIILLEGNLIFCNEELRNLIDLKIFIRTDKDERLARMILDCENKEDTLIELIKRYRAVEKDAFEKFIAPSMRFADIIIPRGAESKPALDLLKENLIEWSKKHS